MTEERDTEDEDGFSALPANNTLAWAASETEATASKTRNIFVILLTYSWLAVT